MKLLFITMLFLIVGSPLSFADATPTEKQFYRDMIKTVRTSGEFKVAMPDRGDLFFNYKMELDEPKWDAPITSDYPVSSVGKNKFIRSFWDKIFLKEGSYIYVGGEQIPLTCIHVAGQDNRKSGKTGPQIPDFIIKFMFIANDWTCSGPLNPGWPGNGGKKEAWETYLHYEVRDPTIMLPSEIGLRFRWSEFEAVLVN